MGRIVRGVAGLIGAVRQSRRVSRPARYMVDYILRRLRLNEKIIFRYEGACFRLRDNPVSRQMFYDAPHWHGTADIRVLKKLLRPGEVFIDIGANVGSHSIVLARYLGEPSIVHAFEPHPRTFAYLQANVELNQMSNIKIYNVALGEVEGTVEFSDFAIIDDQNRVLSGQDERKHTISVPLKRLDSFGFYQEPIGTIKLDVEGYELFVLRGAERTLAAAQFLYFEASREHYARYDYTPEEVACFLSDSGWRIFRFVEEEVIQPVEKATSRLFATRPWENWIATRSVDLLLERSALQIQEG
jgi:FkbM family methyltransferase